jgi:adenylosuccinate synthase
MLSGVTKLIITKTDVLDGFNPISVATSYQLADGSVTQQFPFQISEAASVKPVYQSFDGWLTPVSGVVDYEAFDAQFKEFCHFIATSLGVPIAFISNGKGRDELIEVLS